MNGMVVRLPSTKFGRTGSSPGRDHVLQKGVLLLKSTRYFLDFVCYCDSETDILCERPGGQISFHQICSLRVGDHILQKGVLSLKSSRIFLIFV